MNLDQEKNWDLVNFVTTLEFLVSLEYVVESEILELSKDFSEVFWIEHFSVERAVQMKVLLIDDEDHLLIPMSFETFFSISDENRVALFLRFPGYSWGLTDVFLFLKVLSKYDYENLITFRKTFQLKVSITF